MPSILPARGGTIQPETRAADTFSLSNISHSFPSGLTGPAQ
ncbi:hypothetical protein [Nocardia sp. R6R-6]